MIGRLGAEDKQLVATLRGALTCVAASLGTSDGEPSLRLLDITLDGAEFVIRNELETGDHDKVLQMMPSFVFLVALSVTDRERALEASARTTELVETGP
ncbi:MAG TPA: hypothetical protein VHU86_07480 [Solirubrobacterales bacterium]|nr:hypothetical protein [Solirubrobacterales bacterium]